MSRIFTANYHTHTAFCHHASGEIRDYAVAAVKAGFSTLGFSCHAPYSFPDGYVSWFHMSPEDAAVYADEINALKEEFSGQLDIKLGFEAEYYPRHFDDLLERVNSLGCDYLILGQHFTNSEYDGIYCGIRWKTCPPTSVRSQKPCGSACSHMWLIPICPAIWA